MTSRFHFDYETRSTVDLKAVGGYEYSRHPSTDVLCVAWKIDGGVVNLDTPPFSDFVAAFSAFDGLFFAHNAFFEQCITHHTMHRRYGCPIYPIERYRCTAAKAAAMGLPRDLETVAELLELPVKKDMGGNRIMRKLSAPRRLKSDELVWWTPETAPDDFQKLYAYCKTDVEAEYYLDHALPDLSAREQRIWFLDQKINFRGVCVDIPAVRTILGHVEKTKTELVSEFKVATNYEVLKPTQRDVLHKWLIREGLDVPDIQAGTLDKALRDVPDIKPHVRRAVELRRMASKTSTAKYEAMLSRASHVDGRLRDILLYSAAITHRWGGRGVQLQNLPRPKVDSDTAIRTMLYTDYEWLKDVYPNLMDVYSSAIRGMLIPSPGNRFKVGDFSSIEAMVNAWLAGQESTLELFRNNEDVYCDEASYTYGFKVTKAHKYERSVGKVEILAFGYQGGIGAMATMSKGYGVSLLPAYDILWPTATTDEQTAAHKSYKRYLGRESQKEHPDPIAEPEGLIADVLKQRWRAKNSAIVEWWSILQSAATDAILSGQKIRAGRLVFAMHKGSLVCKLPSGNTIVYPKARVVLKDNDWGGKSQTIKYYGTDPITGRPGWTYTYGGKLCENVTQAVSRDLLADAMVRADDAGFDIAFHVHDEIATDDDDDSLSLEYFEQVMSEVPAWAGDLPIRVEVFACERYRK